MKDSSAKIQNLYCQLHLYVHLHFLLLLNKGLSVFVPVFSVFADIQLFARRLGVIWTQGFVLPALQTLCHGHLGCS